jgi:hypothetical protein
VAHAAAGEPVVGAPAPDAADPADGGFDAPGAAVSAGRAGLAA